MVGALVVSLAALCGIVHADLPPDRMNYQGVLRDSAGVPLDGSYDMVFSFYDAETGGTLLYRDAHVEGDAGQITVSDGLFVARLGTGDKIGGIHSYLREVFSDNNVWLEVKVGLETLSPRVQVQAAGYSFNASKLNGRSADHYLDTSDVTQTKYGTLKAENQLAGTYGIEGRGMEAGGFFGDWLGSGQAKLGHNDTGVWASGMVYGGHFTNPEYAVTTYLASDVGMRTDGGISVTGGAFLDYAILDYADVDYLRAKNNDALYLNSDGPEGDATIYFFDGGTSTGARMRWDDSESAFQFNRSLRSSGSVRGSSFQDYSDSSYYIDPGNSISGNLAGDLIIGDSSGTDDDYLYFDLNAEHLAWRNAETRLPSAMNWYWAARCPWAPGPAIRPPTAGSETGSRTGRTFRALMISGSPMTWRWEATSD
jgi:hypothetical protein